MQTQFVDLLVVDDEPAMRRVLKTSLCAIGFTIQEAASGEAALGVLERSPSQLVLLDINMPGMGGIEACRRIRARLPVVGIVITSVRAGEDDKVLALEAGADDYVTKPYRFRELLARIRSVLRRVRAGRTDQAAILRAGVLELNVETRMLLKAGAEVHLSQKEFGILEFLMRHCDTPVPHARLLQAVWGPEYGGETEYLRSYIKSLRKKIETVAARPQYICTEPWLGYRFRNPSATDGPLKTVSEPSS
jgi:two-component system, OmpR family, KDP operon response regulator KdpE